MSVDLLRIDDRLVHGQVVEGWLRTLHIERLVVASDDVSSDDTQKALYSLAVPDGVSFECLPVDRAAAEWRSGAWKTGRTLVLVSSPQDVRALKEAGAPVRSVNVGGMHFREGRTQILKAISVGEEERATFCMLLSAGVALEARPLPLDEPVDLAPYLDTGFSGDQPK